MSQHFFLSAELELPGFESRKSGAQALVVSGALAPSWKGKQKTSRSLTSRSLCRMQMTLDARGFGSNLHRSRGFLSRSLQVMLEAYSNHAALDTFESWS